MLEIKDLLPAFFTADADAPPPPAVVLQSLLEKSIFMAHIIVNKTKPITRAAKNPADRPRLLSYEEMSPLGKQLWNIRRDIEADPNFQPLSDDEVRREVLERRGGNFDER